MYITSAVPSLGFEGCFCGVNIDSKTSSGTERGTEDVTEMGRWLEKKEATKTSKVVD